MAKPCKSLGLCFKHGILTEIDISNYGKGQRENIASQHRGWGLEKGWDYRDMV